MVEDDMSPRCPACDAEEEQFQRKLKEENPMAETYRLELGVSTNRIGSGVEEGVPLIDYGYTDEEWDALSEKDQDKLIADWIEEFVWENTDSWGRVHG